MSTVKTKVGFDSKPYDIEPFGFYTVLHMSAKVYGEAFLVLVVLLSLPNWFYLRSVHRRNSVRLYALQQEAKHLEDGYQKLCDEYGMLSASQRLESLAYKTELQKPVAEQTIYLSEH